MTGKITYIFPSRSRPEKFFSALDNIRDLSESDNYEIICALDLDDTKMNNDEVKEKLRQYPNVHYYFGFSESKVHAINREIKNISQDTKIVIIMSDDMSFIAKGHDNIIRSDMQSYFPEFNGVLHYLDGTPAADRIITMSIMGINHFKKFNYLYYPGYISVYCDNEFTEVAKKLGVYKLMGTDIYRHLHPVWGLAETDELYKRNEDPHNYDRDRELFFQREKKNFDL